MVTWHGYFILNFVSDALSTPLEQLAPTESLYAEAFVQTEATNEVLLSQHTEDEGGETV